MCEETKTSCRQFIRSKLTTIRHWFREFKRGRTSILDEERPGRPNDQQSSRYRLNRPSDEVQRD